jgi:hypothetical protein
MPPAAVAGRPNAGGPLYPQFRSHRYNARRLSSSGWTSWLVYSRKTAWVERQSPVEGAA